MKNCFSVDLEDWFCVYNLSRACPYSQWPDLDARIEGNTEKLLSLLDRHNVKATFFILGWIADRFPALIETIAGHGHELATHGYTHSLLYSLTEQQFAKEIKDSIVSIKKSCDIPIRGFRAPSFSVSTGKKWIFSVLKDNGIVYDSSLFPISFHPDYGSKGSYGGPFEMLEGFIEFPMSCFKVCGVSIPCCGGGYFRMMPYAMTAYGIRQCNKEGRPAVFYIHPWEIDPLQPRVKLPFLKRFRHYINLSETEKKLDRLLSDFEFGTIASVLNV